MSPATSKILGSQSFTIPIFALSPPRIFHPLYFYPYDPPFNPLTLHSPIPSKPRSQSLRPSPTFGQSYNINTILHVTRRINPLNSTQ